MRKLKIPKLVWWKPEAAFCISFLGLLLYFSQPSFSAQSMPILPTCSRIPLYSWVCVFVTATSATHRGRIATPCASQKYFIYSEQCSKCWGMDSRAGYTSGFLVLLSHLGWFQLLIPESSFSLFLLPLSWFAVTPLFTALFSLSASAVFIFLGRACRPFHSTVLLDR